MRNTDLAPLFRLARLHGILVRYRDGFGRQCTASAETLLALLRQLGASADSLEGIPRAITEQRLSVWRSLIEPVTVCWERSPAQCLLRLTAGQADATLRCELQLESGETHSWRNDLAAVRAHRSVEAAGEAFVTKTLVIPREVPWGYHRLRLQIAGRSEETLVISAPEKAHPLRDPDGARRWGVFLPLYALHSEGSLGCGDFSDLTSLFGWAQALGASMVGTLPLLAAYLDEPCDPSPYTPVSRQFWNEFYLHLPSIPEIERSPEARSLLDSSAYRETIDSLRHAGLTDYKRQMALKRAVLEELARTLLAEPSGRLDEFWRYVNERPRLEAYARFRAVQERQRQVWTRWPRDLREGRISPGDFHERARVYHLYVQWLADQQLQTLAEKSDGRGLYLDLPLGVHPGGFDVWQEPEAFAQDVAGGAPPDRFFTKGQDWGFAPIHPEAVRARGYTSFIACVRHHLRHAGVLRIDHVMGLHRLYWIPKGFAASQGAYVSYHAEEFYAILNLESRRHGAAIVGEDLGTVPERVRASMNRHGYAGMYVAQFELDPDPARAIHPTPPTTLASLNTHDMRPFAGVWEGLDIADQIELGLLDEQQGAKDLQWKESCKWAVIEFLRRHGWLGSEDADLASILQGCLYEIASRDTAVMLVNLEDLWLETSSQNTPGTVDERPNWRRKARYGFEQFRTLPAVIETLRRVNQLRHRGR